MFSKVGIKTTIAKITNAILNMYITNFAIYYAFFALFELKMINLIVEKIYVCVREYMYVCKLVRSLHIYLMGPPI